MALLDIRTGKPIATTRRKVLGGLAGILAAGTAPAAFIRSAIGARMAAWSGGALSAKSYVQDGLVAMWDGIENAGWGTHDASLSHPIDIIGKFQDVTWSGTVNSLSNEFEMTAGAFFRGDASVPDGTTGLSWEMAARYPNSDNCVDGGSIALGYVFWGDGFSYKTRIGVQGGNNYFAPIVFNGTSSYSTLDNYKFNARSLVCTTSYSIGIDQPAVFATKGSVIFTGTVAPTSITPTSAFAFKASTPTGGGLDYFVRNIRVYNRALTAAEIAANYAVDKARFGLT